MPSPPSEPGKIITFYSYKGGTGRSMAVANVACLLARRLAKTAHKVLVMDWDLEAPGLHRYFSAKSEQPEFEQRPGVANYFSDLQHALSKEPKLYEMLISDDDSQRTSLDRILPLDSYIIPEVVTGVDFMRAGRFDSQYAKLVGSFSWIEFFERYGAVLRPFRDLLVSRFGYTLVDSRTGVTDVSGICTTLLPEKLVGVFTPNRQSLLGLTDLVAQALKYRGESNDFRPLAVFPLPSRIENAEKDLKEQWRRDYQEEFETLFRRVYESERCDLTKYFDDVILPQVSYYAYGENIAVLQERPDAVSLSAAYERFVRRLLESDFAWENPEEEPPQPATASQIPGQKATKYDAFLSYNNSDVKTVSQVRSRLSASGIKSFFPQVDIAPGADIMAARARAMSESKAVIIFVGPAGLGPWQEQETLAELESFFKDSSKLIVPVLLPKAPDLDALRLPNFLRRFQWLDLREGVTDDQAMGNLIWALTGNRPVARKRFSRLLWAFVACVMLGGLAVLTYMKHAGNVSDASKNSDAGTISNANKVSDEYRQRINSYPYNQQYHYELAVALANEGGTDEAIQQYVQAIRLSPTPGGTTSEAAGGLRAVLAKVDIKKAISIYRDILRQAPDLIDLHNGLGDLLRQQGDVAGAIAEHKQAIRLESKSAESHYLLGRALEAKGDQQTALSEYETAVKISPTVQTYADAEKSLFDRLNSQPSGAEKPH